MARSLEPGAWVLAVLTACSFDASGVAEAGADGSTSGTPTTTSPTAGTSTTSPTTSATTLDGSASIGESSGSGGTIGETSSSGGEGSSSSGTSNAESQGESTSTGEPEPCVELLWVSNSADPVGTTDELLHAHLESLGYVITRVIDDQAVAADADGMCAVLLSAVSDSVDIENEFRDVTVPVLVWEFALFDNMGFAVEASEYNLDHDVEEIAIVDAGHPLAAGLDGTVTIYLGIGRLNWALANNAEIVAVRTDNASHASLFAYEAGATLADGTIAAGRRVGLPFSNATEGELQPAALAILTAAVAWATAP